MEFVQNLMKDKKKLVATLQEKKYMDVVSDFETLKMVTGWVEFKDNKTILVDGKTEYTALKFIIATGATTNIPNIEGLNEIGYLTNRLHQLSSIGQKYLGYLRESIEKNAKR